MLSLTKMVLVRQLRRLVRCWTEPFLLRTVNASATSLGWRPSPLCGTCRSGGTESGKSLGSRCSHPWRFLHLFRGRLWSHTLMLDWRYSVLVRTRLLGSRTWITWRFCAVWTSPIIASRSLPLCARTHTWSWLTECALLPRQWDMTLR